MIIYHQKVIFPHKSVPYSPEKIIQPHLFNIFTLKYDLRTFVEKMLRVALRTCMGQIAQDAWIGVGRGAQPNLGNACIMGKNYPAISALRDAYFHFRDKIENWHNWISCFEMRRRASYFQSRTLRREREFSHPISGFETRLRNSVIFSRDSRRD